jgi:hypothetical protein
MTGFTGYLVLLVIVGCSQATPRIMSRPEVISVYKGQAAMFKCQISNPQDGVASWSSVTYNFKIYQGNRLLANDSAKYSLKSTAGVMYNLQLLNIERSDQGFYKCAIEGTDQEIVTQLKVLDKPSMLLPGESTLNVTDCCLAEGVSKSCLPICNPSQVDLEEFSLSTNCATVENLQGLSKCLAGDSNLDNCCINRKVKAQCLDICHNTVSSNLSTEYFSKCYADASIKEIFSCFQIGYESLPSEPKGFNAAASCDTASGTILMRWSEPSKNPQKVTGYKIMYKSSTEENYNSVLVKNPEAHEYLLKGSKNLTLSNNNYMIHISALALDGISSESVQLDVYVPNCSFPVEQSTIIFESTTALSRSTDGKTFIIDRITSITPTRSTDGLAGFMNDDKLVKVAIGVGVSMFIVCLAAVILLAIFFMHKSRLQGSVSFENPSFHKFEDEKLKAEFDKNSADKKLSEKPGVLYI